MTIPREKTRGRMILALIFLLLVVMLWQLGLLGGVSTTGGPHGFSYVKPQTARLHEDGGFSVSMLNGVDTEITFVEGKATSGEGAECALDVVGDASIGAGDRFELRGNECHSGLKAGDTHALEMRLKFRRTISNTTVNYTEWGIVRGIVKPA